MKIRLLSGVSEKELQTNLTKRNQLKIAILEEFYRNGSNSIPELGKLLSLSTPTITRAIDELIVEKLIQEVGIGTSSGGRKPFLYGLNASSRYILGIDLNRYKTQIGLFDILNQTAYPVKVVQEGLETQNDILHFIKVCYDEYITESKIDVNKLLGVGIALPGLIDIKTGISYSYLHSDDKSVSNMIEEMLHVPVLIENDVRAVALGEQAFGLAHGKQNVLCIFVGAGIGLGMILNGQLYEGNSGFAGEFGHIQVEQDGQLCICGKIGCLETLASGTTMIRKAKSALTTGATSLISSLVDNNIEKIDNEVILNAAEMGDQYAISLLSDIGEHLGKGIAILIHLFNPELIIIGGELTEASNYIIDPIQQNLNKYTIAKIRRDATIVTSNLGNKACLLGTVALVMNNVFEI